jgi:hypothetical protein
MNAMKVAAWSCFFVSSVALCRFVVVCYDDKVNLRSQIAAEECSDKGGAACSESYGWADYGIPVGISVLGGISGLALFGNSGPKKV